MNDKLGRLDRLNRRQLLKSLGICAAGGATGLASLLRERRASAAPPDQKPRFLIVIAAAGGGSLVDSFLAIRRSEAGPNASTINCFTDTEVKSIPGTNIRAVDLSRNSLGQIPFPFSANQSNFVQAHKDDLMIVTQQGTSVNHTVAQKRSLTGNEAWKGRTLQEAISLQYGASFPLPNVNMTGQGYIENGTDKTLPRYCYNEPVADAKLWPLSLHGSRGIKNLPSAQRIALARKLRNDKLEPESHFFKTFSTSSRLSLWQQQRANEEQLESLDLITKLNVYPDQPPQIPLHEYGLDESPDGSAVRLAFPNYQLDPLEAQAALAYLLIKNRVSVTVTISPSFAAVLDTSGIPRLYNPPLAFDFSHNSHRSGQAFMWDRVLSIAHRLIALLKAAEFESGTSFWDRSMIYFATDFGRSKKRPADSEEFGTAHDLNNGYAICSPLVNGNKILGGVDPTTALTYGFDPEDPQGTPTPQMWMTEKQIYSGILHALGVDTSGAGLPDMRAMRKLA